MSEPIHEGDPVAAEIVRRAVASRLFGDPAPGLRAGRFIVGKKIGEGAMGVVYEARDPELDRDVALKFLTSAGDGSSVLPEAKALAKLRHPNVVSVYEVGSFRGHTFVAMERVAGRTLREWADEPRSAAEIVEMYASVGRGLAAAHAAGIVHRDVKPDNVLVDRDGQPRVVDFGLARESEAPAEPSTHARIGTRPAGTPGYMAPEILRGERATPLTDQFSFAASLYEALFRRRPFVGSDADEIASAVLAGEAREPPDGVSTPAVNKAILRGLSTDPARRHPSMDAMVAALSRPAGAGAWTAALGPIAIVVVLLAAGHGTAATPPCADAASGVRDVWTPRDRAVVREAFLATSLPYATDAFASVESRIDAYAASWASMSDESCRATHERGVQSGELLDLRTECLARRRDALEALVRTLSSADARVVERSVDLVERLPPIGDCGDAAALRAHVRPPDDPTARAELSELERALDAAASRYAVGQLKEAATDVETIVARARELTYAPFLGRALFTAGSIASARGEYENAEKLLAEAVKFAQAGKDARLATRIAIELVRVTGVQEGKFDKAKVWADVAAASAAEAGDPELGSELDDRFAMALAEAGKIPEALERLRRAIAALEARGDTETLGYAGYLADLGNVLDSAGSFDEALSVLARSLALRERHLGVMHPEVARASNNLAVVLERKGRYEEARAAYQRAYDIAVAVGGMDSMPGFLDNLAGVLFTLGHDEEAFEKRKQALAMREAKLPPNHPKLAISWNNLGAAYLRAERYVEARAAFEKGLAIRKAAYGEEHPDVASSIGNIGEVDEQEGKLEDALARFEQAAAMKARTAGEEHAEVGYWLAAVGRAELALKKPAAAREHLARGVAILEKSGAMPEDLAKARADLARAVAK